MTKAFGATNRPGGFIITDQAISFCSFQPGTKSLDLGCGSGATVEPEQLKDYLFVTTRKEQIA
jgi:hypothetical protein